MADYPHVFPAPTTDPGSAPILDAASRLSKRLRQAGFKALLAGGFVRDLQIGRPIHDIDVATDARPDEVQALFPNCRSIGKSFGVIHVTWESFSFEVATFRRDLDYHDGRHPEAVVFSSPEDDARRRDFTINGMFYDPEQLVVIDYVNGRRDLESRCIRAIGNPSSRFQEDHLRVMRAIRFASVLEFSIENETWKAIKDHAPSLRSISAERLRDELLRTLLESPRPGEALTMLRDAGILDAILPEVQAMNGVEQPPEFHPEGDVFIHTALMLNLMTERTPQLIWSILMHDVAKPKTFAMGTDREGRPRIQFRGHAEQGAVMSEAIMKRFHCSNEDIEAVSTTVRNHMRFSAVPDMRESTLRKWVGAPTFSLELTLHRIDCLASHGSLKHVGQIEALQERLRQEPVLPAPLIRGGDLIQSGMAPGPSLGQELKRIYDAQLEGAFKTREEALAWLEHNPPA